MTDLAPAARRLPRARPDGLLAGLLLAFLAAAGLFYVNIMPAIVDGLIGGLHFTTRQAGLVASMNVYGAALGAFTAVFLVKRLPWKTVATTALASLVLIDLVSIAIQTPGLLTAVRFVHGMFGGTLMGVAFAVIARTGAPDKTFGMLLLVQYGVGGLGLMVLPRLVPVFGPGVLFVSLAGFSAIALAALPFLAEYPIAPPPDLTLHPRQPVAWTPLVLTFAAIFLFQSTNMGVGAYVIGLGRHYGLGTDYISGALGVGNWIGAVGSLLVIVMGTRFGRLWPFVLGMAVTVAGTWAFLLSGQPHLFFIANAVTSVTWSFVIPYLLGMAAAFDKAGQMGALGGFFSKIGLATGPLAGVTLLGETDYVRLVTWGLAGMGLCLLAGAIPALILDRGRAAAPD